MEYTQEDVSFRKTNLGLSLSLLFLGIKVGNFKYIL